MTGTFVVTIGRAKILRVIGLRTFFTLPGFITVPGVNEVAGVTPLTGVGVSVIVPIGVIAAVNEHFPSKRLHEVSPVGQTSTVNGFPAGTQLPPTTGAPVFADDPPPPPLLLLDPPQPVPLPPVLGAGIPTAVTIT